MHSDTHIISCHTEQAEWDASSLCSVCGSMTPERFALGLSHNEFNAGWVWESNNPLYCELSSGRFFAAHLMDMPENWLYEHLPIIATHTGVIFMWDGKEQFKFIAQHSEQKTIHASDEVCPQFVQNSIEISKKLLGLRK